MPANDDSLDRLTKLQELTRDYARYSRSAGGLAAAAGGVLALTSYFASGLLPASTPLRAVLIGMPLLWLIAKQWMANRYYQRFGQVEELTDTRERRTRVAFTVCVALVSVVVTAGALLEFEPIGSAPWTVAMAGYVVVVAALPLIVWLWLRSPLDLAVGVFLFCQAALASKGSGYALWSSAIVFPAGAVLMIGAGIRDHRRFRLLELQIRQLAQSRQAQA